MKKFTRRRKQVTCTCSKYNFPHRVGSGKCSNSPGDGAFCSHCGCACSPKMVDNGIGAYEYWGSKGVDIRNDIESDCCESSVTSDMRLRTPFTRFDFASMYNGF